MSGRRSLLLVLLGASALLAILVFAGLRQRARPPFEQIVAFHTESTPAEPPLPLVPDGPVRGVILFIGDGMGLANIAAARFALVGADGRLAMERMPVTGLLAVHAAGKLIPDSASTATALASGVKTGNGRVGTGPNGERLRTIAEAAHQAGFATGVVTTAEIVDATPAAFAAHADSREQRAAIAGQLLDSDFDLLLGGGARWFLPPEQPPGVREDGTDLLATARQRGYQVVRDAAELEASRQPKLLGLFDFDIAFVRALEPSLQAMTGKALELVAARPRFFLMIEHEGTDTLAHHHKFSSMAGAIRELDQAIEAALAFAQRDGQVLVVVTADHDTGGLAIRPGPSPQTMQLIWSTGSHTAVPVPLFAYGPGAMQLTGLRDNTEVPKILARLLQIEIEEP